MLYYERLAHINFQDLVKLKNHMAIGINFSDKIVDICDSCMKSKQKRFPFNNSTPRAHKCLELIHSDTLSLGGAKYFLILVVILVSRETFIYFLKSKDEVLETFQYFKNMVENQKECKIKKLRTDNGSEYCSRAFEDFLRNSGIQHLTSMPFSPEQNCVAERYNRTIVEKARCMLQHANLNKSFRAEAPRLHHSW